MRSAAVVLLALVGCTFDASGLGRTPLAGSSSGLETSSTGAPGPGETSAAQPATATTVEVSGSASMSAGTEGPDPTTTTATATTTTTAGDDTTTTEVDLTTTGEPCPMVMLYQDFDNDGYGDPNAPGMVCEGSQSWVPDNTDCNDMASGANPGMVEVCDTIDNNCDGAVDEYDADNNGDSCGGCDFEVREARLYYFCSVSKGWDAAQEHCEAHGLDLVKDDGPGEHEWLVQRIGDTGGWWLGGNDKASEGNFVWVSDGSPVPKPGHWGGGEPNNQNWFPLEGADCLLLIDANGDLDFFGAGGAWNDHKCGSGQKFICEGPLP